MKKRVFVFSLSLVLLVTSQVGTIFAESSLEHTAFKQIGVDYRYGGTTSKGFDCSGFTMYVFKQMGVTISRASKSQARLGKAVTKNNLRPGDLIFFNTNGYSISHVGIYLGNGEFIHASSSKGVTKNKLSQAYYAKRYVTARRILGEVDYKELASNTINDEQDAKVALLLEKKAS